MSTLAHEGNPTEDEITITAGDVLSTAQLDIDFQFFGGAPNVPSTADPDLTVISSTCGNVFDWSTREQGDDWIYLRDAGNSGATTDQLDDTSLDLNIFSSEQCYGVIWQKHHGYHYGPTFSELGGGDVLWEVIFNGIVDGIPRAGPCNWVHDNTLHSSATLYALVVNADTNLTELRSWSSASLGSIDNSTLLDTMRMPVVGEALLIEMMQFDGASPGANGVFGFIYAVDGTQMDTCQSLFEDVQTFSISAVRHVKLGAGFVSIGGLTAGTLNFRARAVPVATRSPYILIHNS